MKKMTKKLLVSTAVSGIAAAGLLVGSASLSLASDHNSHDKNKCKGENGCHGQSKAATQEKANGHAAKPGKAQVGAHDEHDAHDEHGHAQE